MYIHVFVTLHTYLKTKNTSIPNPRHCHVYQHRVDVIAVQSFNIRLYKFPLIVNNTSLEKPQFQRVVTWRESESCGEVAAAAVQHQAVHTQLACVVA